MALSPDPSVSTMASNKTHEMLEDENDRLMDEMARKIDTLKTVSTLYTRGNFFQIFSQWSFQLSIDIGDEVKGQNSFLKDMVSLYSILHSLFLLEMEWWQDQNFDSAGGFLSGSMKRVKNMGKAGHNRWMCYMMIFIIIVFFVCYYIISWRN